MDAFEALADVTRRRLLRVLSAGPRTAGALAATEEVSRPAISRHLRVLRESGLVVVHEVGRTREYRLEPGALEAIAAEVRELAHPSPPFAAGQLDALELEVRRTVRDQRSAPSGAAPTEEEIA
jgi:DNA-binding transcriptional ArsR family regulator